MILMLQVSTHKLSLSLTASYASMILLSSSQISISEGERVRLRVKMQKFFRHRDDTGDSVREETPLLSP
jgi:hypothetical protein